MNILVPRTAPRAGRSRTAGPAMCIASVFAVMLMGGCSDHDVAAEFRTLKSRPVMLNLARSRDASSDQPLRALEPSLVDGNDAMVSLGRQLFHDVRLSGDRTLSCASCHAIPSGGDDGRRTSLGINGSVGPINAPTVLNAALNFRQFWDGRAPDLTEQAKGPVANPIEMGAQWPGVVATLAADSKYPELFERAFGDDQIDEQRVADAIARFEQTLLTPSPFDRYLLGDTGAISVRAQRGYELFKGHGCSACHQGINVGGNLYQKFGALQMVAEIENNVDRGRENVTGNETDLGVFKVPSLRNIALTAPYFHNGMAPDLPTAVRIMGAAQLGRVLPEDDISHIVEFLQSLTGSLPRVTLREGDHS